MGQLLYDQRSPAFLASLVAHVLILLLLAIFSIQPQLGVGNSLTLSATIESPEQVSLEVIEGASELSPDPVSNPVQEFAPPPANTAMPLETISEPWINSERPVAVEPEIKVPTIEEWASISGDGNMFADGFRSSQIDERNPSSRSTIAQGRGGNQASERAVEAALEWLAAHQSGDGAWRLDHRLDECPGDCRNPGIEGDLAPSATGLSLLAFLGAGYTHKSGKYQDVVRRGIYYLVTRIEQNQNGGSLTGLSDKAMYNHGIATLALCEALQMTEDKDLFKPCGDLVSFTCTAQHEVGGWGYLPHQPGDLTISAWQIMSLKSAQRSGIAFPSNTLRNFDKFLDTQQTSEGSFYGYRAPGKSPGTTSMGLLMRMYRGWHNTDPRLLKGLNYLEKTGPSDSDFYYNYYATQVFFHQQGPAWPLWNERLRDQLIRTQVQSGHSAGSWFVPEQYSKVGGRIYCTAMAALTLEVYYRYSPMYQKIEIAPFEF